MYLNELNSYLKEYILKDGGWLFVTGTLKWSLHIPLKDTEVELQYLGLMQNFAEFRVILQSRGQAIWIYMYLYFLACCWNPAVQELFKSNVTHICSHWVTKPRDTGGMEAEAALTALPRIPQLERGGKLVDLIMYALCCFRGNTKQCFPRVCASGFTKTFQRSLVHQALWLHDNAVQPQGIPVDRGLCALLVLLFSLNMLNKRMQSLIQKQSTCSPETGIPVLVSFW